jgi:zinc transport system substrate-binding protein
MKVVATIAPLEDFARAVGDDLVEVKVLVPPGASPHTFEPTTGQFAFLSEASVFVMNGLELETWATDVVGKVGNENMVKVVAGDAIPKERLIKAGQYGAEADEGRPYDPHVWLDPTLAAYEVNAIAGAYSKADPAHRDTYIRNAATYIQQLNALDREIAGETAAFSKKSFIALHPAWTYFARRYGLDQIGVVEEMPGKEPSGSQINRLVDQIKSRGITVVFAEPQFNPKAAEVIAREGGSQVKMLDPLGNPEKPDVSSYVKLMRHDVAVMGEALR